MSTSSAMINGGQGQRVQGGPSGMCLHQVVQRYSRRVWKCDLKIKAVSFRDQAVSDRHAVFDLSPLV